MSALEVHETKICVEQSEVGYNDFLDDLCVCVRVCEPPALFSCEYTLTGSHSVPIYHTFGADMALSR